MCGMCFICETVSRLLDACSNEYVVKLDNLYNPPQKPKAEQSKNAQTVDLKSAKTDQSKKEKTDESKSVDEFQVSRIDKVAKEDFLFLEKAKKFASAAVSSSEEKVFNIELGIKKYDEDDNILLNLYLDYNLEAAELGVSCFRCLFMVWLLL